MSDFDFDLIVIGAGPGGYVAAIRGAQLGLKTACIEKRATAGGTCLNVGCIPSKALLHSSEKYEEASTHLANHGIKVGEVELDLKALMARKDKVVEDLTKGIGFLFKKNKVTNIRGSARILKPGEVEVVGENGSETFTTRNIIIATGSDVAPLPGVEIDEEKIVSSINSSIEWSKRFNDIAHEIVYGEIGLFEEDGYGKTSLYDIFIYFVYFVAYIGSTRRELKDEDLGFMNFRGTATGYDENMVATGYNVYRPVLSIDDVTHPRPAIVLFRDQVHPLDSDLLAHDGTYHPVRQRLLAGLAQ